MNLFHICKESQIIAIYVFIFITDINKTYNIDRCMHGIYNLKVEIQF